MSSTTNPANNSSSAAAAPQQSKPTEPFNETATRRPTQEEIKAAARAYALSSSSDNGGRKKRALKQQQPAASQKTKSAENNNYFKIPYRKRVKLPFAAGPPTRRRKEGTVHAPNTYPPPHPPLQQRQHHQHVLVHKTKPPPPHSCKTSLPVQFYQPPPPPPPFPPPPQDEEAQPEPLLPASPLLDLDPEYELFVKSLHNGTSEWRFDDNNNNLNNNTEDEDFDFTSIMDDDDDEDDDGDDDDGGEDCGEGDEGLKEDRKDSLNFSSPNNNCEYSTSVLNDLEGTEEQSIDPLLEELDWLEEEDIQAAIATLLEPLPSQQLLTDVLPHHLSSASPTTPLTTLDSNLVHSASVCRSAGSTMEQSTSNNNVGAGGGNVTQKQCDRLQRLIQKHVQLLMQQAVLSVRAAAGTESTTSTGDHDTPQQQQPSPKVENYERLLADTTTIHGAVGMLQDLDQHRKDSIRMHVQLLHHDPPPLTSSSSATSISRDPATKRSLWQEPLQQHQEDHDRRRLTRAQFAKRLQGTNKDNLSVFDVDGMNKLHDCLQSVFNGSIIEDRGGQGGGEPLAESVLHFESNVAACKQILTQAGTVVDESLLPDANDLSTLFLDVHDILGKDFRPPTSDLQKAVLCKSRFTFTTGEDNLVLRGVNLFGEKQWTLLSNRFLPDRSVHGIMQRHSKLCLRMYQAHAIQIDQDGNLETPPKYDSVDDVDKDVLEKIQRVDPPAIFNVHRWSWAEDLTILKVVPIVGPMWAEVSARFLPHRDRGHIRKRYQLLERRVKATVSRIQKDNLEFSRIATNAAILNGNVFGKETTTASTNLSSQTSQHMHQARQGPPVDSSKQQKGRSNISLASGAARMALGAVNQAAAILTNAKRADPEIAADQVQRPLSRTAAPGSGRHRSPLPSGCVAAQEQSNSSDTPGGEESRVAFERLTQDSPGAWSDMRSLEHVMNSHVQHGSTETDIASTIIQLHHNNNYSHHEGGSVDSFLYSSMMESGDGDASGLTPLGGTSTPSYLNVGHEANNLTKKPSASLFAGVMKRSNNTGQTPNQLVQRLPQGKSSRKETATASSTQRQAQPASRNIHPPSACTAPVGRTLDGFPAATSDEFSCLLAGSPLNNVFGDTPPSLVKRALMETDLEAISALNILSGQQQTDHPQHETRKKQSDAVPLKKRKQKSPSLFEQVVGDGTTTSKKRKLKF